MRPEQPSSLGTSCQCAAVNKTDHHTVKKVRFSTRARPRVGLGRSPMEAASWHPHRSRAACAVRVQAFVTVEMPGGAYTGNFVQRPGFVRASKNARETTARGLDDVRHPVDARRGTVGPTTVCRRRTAVGKRLRPDAATTGRDSGRCESRATDGCARDPGAPLGGPGQAGRGGQVVRGSRKAKGRAKRFVAYHAPSRSKRVRSPHWSGSRAVQTFCGAQQASSALPRYRERGWAASSRLRCRSTGRTRRGAGAAAWRRLPFPACS